MCIYGSVSCCAGEVFVFPVGNMLVGSMVSVLLGKSKVNDVDQVTLFPKAHQEVVGLDVSVNEGTHVD